jgi:acetylornithine aminotransferase
LKRLCEERQWLYMVDEVQTGIGRTGDWFATQQAGVSPAVLILAKGLGSGVPIGACLARGRAAEVFKPGNHGTTFGGGPLACAAALATLEIMESEGLLVNARERGEQLRAGLETGLASVAGVVAIRGQGLMVGIELDRPCGALVKLALEKGLLINVTSDNVIRLLPPLIIEKAEIDRLLSELIPLVRQFMEGA